MPPPPVVPRATYRIQFNAAFGFDQARAVVPYLASLGVSHLYASPILMARPGSTHGYDVIDFNQLNPELGDEAAFEGLIEALHEHGMGLVLDFVPNHMGVGADNPWWLDVLEWGQASPYANFFDIDWEATGERGKVVLPVLGDQYGAVLEAGELTLKLDVEAGTFFVAYWENRFPIAVRHYPRLLRTAAERAEGEQGAGFRELADRFEELASGGASLERRTTRRQEASLLKTELAALAADPHLRLVLEDALALINGTPERPETLLALHRLLDDQAYRLAYWRVASSEINYRRFFDINELAGLRMERAEVFEATHRLLLRLVSEGKVQGIRLDHIDGLFDPAGYCRRLLERIAQIKAQGGDPAPVEPAAGSPIYLLVEKILARHERLREDLAVAGTTGYEFMNLVNGLFVNPAAEGQLSATYHRFTGDEQEFAAIVIAAKRQILRYSLNSEHHVLAHEFHRLAKQSWLTRDFTLTGMREALGDIVARFPVYRTYITPEGPRPEDRRDLDWAVARARRETGIVDQSIFDFLHAALSTDLASRRGYRGRDVIATAMHFQQLTGPVTAKSFEDTALYRYYRLVSLNEVGGEPDHFGTSPGAFHNVVQREQRAHPLTMLTTSTHDHKRGEDVRARIDALSEVSQDWNRRVRRWPLLNRLNRGELDGAPVPSRRDEYLFYQILVGTWPVEVRTFEDLAGSDFAERIAGYMLKAAREAKLETSWMAQNADYEAGVEQFIRRALDPERSRAFLADVFAFQQRTALIGALNGLAQVLVKLTAPGVPDIYQGTELWDLSLVDPDNRRPVDFELRQHWLDELLPPDELLNDWPSGRIKQFVVAKALAVRRDAPDLFTLGSYLPLTVEGEHAERVVAFARLHQDRAALAIVPRLTGPLLQDVTRPHPPPEFWRDTRVLLPDGFPVDALEDVFTRQRPEPTAAGAISLSQALSAFPVALMVAGVGAAA